MYVLHTALLGHNNISNTLERFKFPESSLLNELKCNFIVRFSIVQQSETTQIGTAWLGFFSRRVYINHILIKQYFMLILVHIVYLTIF